MANPVHSHKWADCTCTICGRDLHSYIEENCRRMEIDPDRAKGKILDIRTAPGA